MSIPIKALKIPVKLKVEKDFGGISDITLVQMGDIRVHDGSGFIDLVDLADDIIYDYIDQAIYILVAGYASENVIFSGIWKVQVTLANGDSFIVPLECIGDAETPQDAFVEDNLVVGHYYST